VLYIRNPAAHGGAVPGVWDRFLSLWPGEVDPEDIMITQRPGHARDIAASAKGYDIIAAVGGDGTASEILSGIMEHATPRPKLATIPGGTGNDIARNSGIHSVEDAVAALSGGNIRTFDIVRADCLSDGQPVYRYAFLDCSLGFSAIPMVKPWMKRLLGPKGAYYLGTAMQVIMYRPPHMTVRWDIGEHIGQTMMVIIGNVERSAGGSMRIAPGARPDDGEFNVIIIPPVSRLKMMFKLMPEIPSGGYIHQSGVRYFPAKKIEVKSNPPVPLEIDGDLFGTTPA